MSIKTSIHRFKRYITRRVKSTVFRDALFGALVALILSPITIVIGFKMNDYLARPILSIEYIYANQIKSLSNLNEIREYFSNSALYSEFVGKNYYRETDLRKLNEDKKNIENEDIITDIFKEFSAYTSYLNHKQSDFKKNLNALDTISESTKIEWAFYYLDGNDGDAKVKSSLHEKFSQSIENISKEVQSLDKLHKSTIEKVVAVRFKISILNRGSTDGLIRNKGTLEIDTSKFSIVRIEPPKGKETLMAVPTYNVNSESYSGSAVGRIEKKAMVELWYELVLKNDTGQIMDLCKNGFFKISLEDQDHIIISKDKYCNEPL